MDLINNIIYHDSLCFAVSLMLFFGFYFLFAKVPNKTIFNNYLKSRRLIGSAILLLSLNYLVHLYYGIRFRDVNAAILMNLSTYFICYWLFSSALTTLLNRFYITRRRFIVHISQGIIYALLAFAVHFCLPKGNLQTVATFGLAAWLFIYGVTLAMRLLIAYRRAVKIFDETSSDDIGAYVKWLSSCTYFVLAFGVGCSLFTFLADQYVMYWICASIPMYIYVFCCYQNYLLFYERVENVLISEMPTAEDAVIETSKNEGVTTPAFYADIANKINTWINATKYLTPGLTIKDLADEIGTNRTYLSNYINSTYNTTFRSWITSLRLEYAKQRLIEAPEQKLSEIAETSGFVSLSTFMKIFKEKEGCTPAQWRKTQN